MARKMPTKNSRASGDVPTLTTPPTVSRTSDKPVVKKGQGLQGNRKATGSPVNY